MFHAAELRPKAQRMRGFVRTVIDKERLKALQAMILELERRAREWVSTRWEHGTSRYSTSCPLIYRSERR